MHRVVLTTPQCCTVSDTVMVQRAKLLGAAAGVTSLSLLVCQTKTGYVSAGTNTDVEGEERKKAVVIGGGVAGVSSAYQLARRGYQVTVLDMCGAPGSQCSAVAAGGMQRSNPVLNKESWLSVMKSWNPLVQSEYKFFHIKWMKTLTDPHFLRWVSLFSYYSLVESEQLKERQNEQFKFTLYSLDYIKQFLKERNLEETCGINPNGALHARYDDNPPAKTRKSLEPITRISKETLFDLDKTVKGWPREAVCADFETESCAGNSEVFTKTLAEICKKELKVTIETETEVTGLELKQQGPMKSVTVLHTNKGTIDIDENTEVVVAGGSWTPKLISLCGYFCPVYPMKGYSVAMDLPPKGSPSRPLEMDIPSRMLIDNKMYISRLGDQVRVTSVGEFSGWDTSPDPNVDEEFRLEARAHVPTLVDIFDVTPTRCGLRPYSADGIILLGRVQNTGNLSVNVGPGFNGWKICLGAADVLAATLNKEKTSQFSFDCSKLAPNTRIRPAPVWSFLSRMLG